MVVVCWRVTTVASLLLLASAGVQAQIVPPDVEAFRRWAGSRLPEGGTWSAVFVPGQPDRYGEYHVAYDWATGAHFFSSGSGGTGQDVEGRAFDVLPNFRSEPTFSLPGYVGEDANLDDYFPTIVLRDLVSRDHSFKRLEPTDDGGYLVVVAWANGRREVSDAEARDTTLLFDDQARLVERGFTYRGVAFVSRMEYDERCPARFAVPARVQRQVGVASGSDFVRELVSVSDSVGRDPVEFFSASAVQRVSVAAGEATRASIASNRRLLSTAHRVSEGPALPGDDSIAEQPKVQTAPLSHLHGPWSKYRWPLVAGGLFVIAIGCVALWRRARG
jgi:hypothetical protein